MEQENSNYFNKMKKRVLVVTNVIAPYRQPLFEEIGERVELHVIYAAKSQPSRSWKPWSDSDAQNYTAMEASGMRLKLGSRYSFIQFRLLGFLNRLKPDVVIASEFNSSSLLAVFYCIFTSTPFIIWSAAISETEQNIGLVRGFFRRWLVKRASAVISVGLAARDYIKSLGAQPEKVFISPNAVTDIREDPEFDTIRREAKEIKLRYPGVCFLFCGNLVPSKGPDLLLDVVGRFKGFDANFWFLGDGPMKNELIEKSNSLNLDNVEFFGFLHEKEKWKMFLAADVFVFPTLQDTWGMVVNEAMYAGCPVVCSCHAGAAGDIVMDGVNGLVVDPNDALSFSRALKCLATDKELYENFHNNALDVVSSEFSIDAAANGFSCAIDYVL